MITLTFGHLIGAIIAIVMITLIAAGTLQGKGWFE